MKFIAVIESSCTSTEGRIFVLAMSADGEWLAVDVLHQFRLFATIDSGDHLGEKVLRIFLSQSTAHSGLVRKRMRRPNARPVLPMTSPVDRPIMQDRPKVNPNDAAYRVRITLWVKMTVDLGAVTEAVTGDSVTVTGGKITLDLWPGQLKTLRIQ